MDSTAVETQKMDEVESTDKNTTGDEEFFEDGNGEFDGTNFSPGRGGFRGGRSWSASGTPPRFRGRGSFGTSGGHMGQSIRGRGGGGGGQQNFFRGGRGGGPGGGGGRFGTPNFDPNWGPPPGMMGNPYGPPPHMMGGGSGPFVTQQMELWVETKTEEGKSYYYHALSRETTWTRPEGPHIKIMNQTEVEALNAKNQQQQQQAQQQNNADKQPSEAKKDPAATNGTDAIAADVNGQSTNVDKTETSPTESSEVVPTNDKPNAGGSADETTPAPQKSEPQVTPTNVSQAQVTPQVAVPIQSQQQQPIASQQINQQTPPSQQQMSHNQQQHQQQHHQQQQQHQHHHQQQQQQHHQMQQHYGGPPPQFGGHQYGMPPPGFGGYPSGPWGMPWQQQQPPQQQAMIEQPAKSLISKPGVIEPQVIARAAEWSEHRAPDGRPYYYHTGRGESVWEKPQAIRDLEAARMAAHAGTSPHPPVNTPSGPVMTAMQINATPVMTPQQIQQQMHQHIAQQQQQQHNTANPMFDPMSFVMKQQNDMKMEESVEAKLEKKRKAEAEKKKKEDEEKAKQQAVAKQQDKTRPISSTPIAGTPWCVVWTGDGRVFFYNPSTRTSVWERPEDLLGRADVDKAIATTPEQLLNVVPGAGATLTGGPPVTNAASMPITTAKEDKIEPMIVDMKKRSESESSSGENDSTPSKKPKLDSAALSKQLEKKGDIGKEAAIEAEVRAARERALVPLDIRIKSFKEMLKEKDVSAFSTWEKELHKIVFDPRYLLLTSRERKQVFEKYVKERAEEERREKRNKMRQKREDFRTLMENCNLHGKSSFSDFAQKYGKDDRFKGIEKMRERESLFNEFIVEVRRREKEEKIVRKEQVRKDFLALLREHSDIDRHSRWIDVKKHIDNDSRYRAVDSSLLREDYFHDYCKMLKDEKKKLKEKERERKEKRDKERRERDRAKRSDKDKDKEKDSSSSGEKSSSNNKDGSGKDKDKRRDSKDSEKDAKKDDEEEEGEHQEEGEHPVTSDDDEADRQQRERDRQIRAENSIKEREKEVQMQLAGHLRDRDKEREHHKRDEAMRHFSALLADLVRNADLTWKEVKKQLRKDHRWELVEQLEREDRERLFNDHIDQLSKKKRDKFREMLDEIPKLSLIAAWKDVKKIIRDDPRYQKYNSNDKCEREFRDYLKDKTIEAKTAFRELLLECKLITHKSFEMIKENPGHLKDVEEILKNDKRYLVLDHITFDRSQIIQTYLEDLHKRGPPPPPTASESTRRK